jgi:post-segregation antitoxin (ccd killing protein)
MPRPTTQVAARRATTITLPKGPLRDARALGINLTRTDTCAGKGLNLSGIDLN